MQQKILSLHAHRSTNMPPVRAPRAKVCYPPFRYQARPSLQLAIKLILSHSAFSIRSPMRLKEPSIKSAVILFAIILHSPFRLAHLIPHFVLIPPPGNAPGRRSTNHSASLSGVRHEPVIKCPHDRPSGQSLAECRRRCPRSSANAWPGVEPGRIRSGFAF